MFAYLFNLAFCCLLLYYYRDGNRDSRILFLYPVFLVWTIIIGGQYSVGTDYPTYLEYFSSENTIQRFEPIFQFLKDFFYSIGLRGQAMFFVFAFINVWAIFKAFKKFDLGQYALLYFLLVTISSFFNNQMNLVRQATAGAFVFWAFAEAFDGNVKKSVVLDVIAMGFHYSAVVVLPFLLFRKLTFFLTKWPKTLLVITLISLFFSMTLAQYINTFLFDMLPNFIKQYTYYSVLRSSSYATNVYGFSNVLPKVILIPLYWLSIGLLDGDELNEKEKFLLRFGILSYALRCIMNITMIISRFALYFWLPSIIPLYFLILHYYNRKENIYAYAIVAYCLLPYIAKVFMGKGEYAYHFFLFS